MRSERCKDLAHRGFLLARVGQDGPLGRGELRSALEAAVEISLALRGAVPPSVAIDAPGMVVAQDQMFRVKTLSAAGLCLVLPSLAPLVDADRHLHPDDSTALETWRLMAEREPVSILFDEDDRALRMLAPRPLSEVFDDEVPGDEIRDSGSYATTPTDVACAEEEGPPTVVPLASHAPPEPATLPRAAAWPPPSAAALLGALEDEEALSAHPPPPPGPARRHPDRSERVMPRDPLSDIGPLDDGTLAGGDPFGPAASSPFEPPTTLPLTPDTYDRYRRELDDADGPKPVRAVETLFRTRYVPLLEALQLGLDDPEVARVVDRFRRTFERSYREGFQALRLTGKRPSMVLDAPDLAARVGRNHGARAVQLLLVDGLRYDLGLRLREILSEELEDRATCVDHTLLWSALPTVTPTQMRLLSQGPRGLREPEPSSDRDPVVHREGSVTTLRRVRIGQRDLLKLDVVEARLRETGPGFDARMDRLAHDVARVLTEVMSGLSPRTLLYVFGDHGFQLPVLDPQATGPAEQGGASPEEVLVPGLAWLVG
ncbi:MAG: hypothetical protein AAF928_10625 [Myxococcota bacterium]